MERRHLNYSNLMSTLAVAFGLLLLSPAVAGADSFVVDSTKDRLDANLADAICADANGRCTLRAAIAEANDTPGADEITLPAGTFGLTRARTAALSNDEGDLDITESVTLTGAGRNRTVIVQTVRDRVLRTAAPNDELTPGAALAALTLRGGDLRGGQNGGGIYNDGELSLDLVAVRDNTAAARDGEGVNGAGVYLGGPDTAETSPVVLSRTLIHGNSTAVKGGGTAQGGGIFVDHGTQSLTISDSRILANRADPGGPSAGGGIAITVPGVLADRTTIAGNRADFGGGVHVNTPTGGAPDLELDSSTVSGNVAEDGAGLYVNGGSAQVENATFSENDGRRVGRGGALYSSAGVLTLAYVTVARNAIRGAILTDNLANIDIEGSIVTGPGPDCGGLIDTFDSDYYNVFGNAACSDGPTDVVADPLVRALADNGGPTRTMALKAASPAIDLVTPECPPPGADQRGAPRAQGPACDAGAFERGSP